MPRFRSGPWVADVKRVVAASSASADAAKVGGALGAALAQLQRASSLAAAKGDFVAAVGALQEWLQLAGLSNKVKGL